jgi:stage III sporulation protein AE
MFTGYMSISGVISGTVDTSTLKATKLVISGVVPVVGNILSDASETILLSTGMIKNSVGSYGIVVLMTLLIGPFLKIGLHYVLMKLTTAVCAVFAGDEITKLIEDYSSAMGYVLAMTGVSCVLLLIGIVCMMKGAG